MLTSPRVVVIDDREEHLSALVGELHRHGVECLPVHYPDDLRNLGACPNLRVLFADLDLLESGGGDDNHFNNIAGLIESTLKPSGPYLIVLWTAYPERAGELHEVLKDRVVESAVPFRVIPLGKSEYVSEDGEVYDDRLLDRLSSLQEEVPALSALFDWEDGITAAAGRGLSSLLDIAGYDDPTVTWLVRRMAEEAVGRENVDSDRFRAVNEALLPVLSDRISSHLPEEGTIRMLDHVFDGVDESQPPCIRVANAQLNRMFNIDEKVDSLSGTERGVVISLDSLLPPEEFRSHFGLDQNTLAAGEYSCTHFRKGSPDFRWVLVQAQAACDHAQRNPGTLPYLLGMDVNSNSLTNNKPRDAVWTSPEFQIGGTVRTLRVNARFQVSRAATTVDDATPLYRLREQLLSELIDHVHTYGNRPGKISFRQ